MPVGILDITPFRDDLKQTDGIEDTSEIPFAVTGKKIILVDDVMYTGRSNQGGLDAVMVRGRPRAVQLAVLIDRGHQGTAFAPGFCWGKCAYLPRGRNRVMLVERDGVDEVSIYTKKRET